MPLDGELYPSTKRLNVFKEYFYLRAGRIRFQVWADTSINIKVVLKIYRNNGTCEHFILDTDYYDVQSWQHKRVTRDFLVHPFPRNSAG